MELKAIHISKKIKKRDILVDISLNLHSGRVYGFVGRNGCGKTMLFRALSGLIRVDCGEVRLNSRLLGKDFAVLPSLGIVLENAGLYPELTGYDNLLALSKLKNEIGPNEIKKAITRVGLDPADKRTFRKYSLGMKQRIVIAQAVMEEPDIIMLDEPTNGLDESGVREIRQLIQEEKERGAMILLASHNKEDIHLLADEVFYLESGKVINHEVIENKK